MTTLPLGLVLDALLKIETYDRLLEIEMPITVDLLCGLLEKCGYLMLAAEVRRYELLSGTGEETK